MATTESFEEFVHATADRLLRSAVLLCRDRHRAEDLLQTTYAIVFSRWKLVARADNPHAYTRTILTRTFLSENRRKRVTELPLQDGADVGSAAGPDPTLRLTLVDALAQLPPLDRAVLVLRFWEDLSIADTARNLDISETACRTRSSRALARLRAAFPDLATDSDILQED